MHAFAALHDTPDKGAVVSAGGGRLQATRRSARRAGAASSLGKPRSTTPERLYRRLFSWRKRGACTRSRDPRRGSCW